MTDSTENRFLHTHENNHSLPGEPLNERYTAIISEYFNNGYNGAKAVRDINKTNNGNEGRLFKQIYDRPEVKEFIQRHQLEIQNKSDIKQVQIIRELLNIAFSDGTQFINLSPAEIKLLPPDARRLIISFDHKKLKYTDREGIEREEETIRIKFADKLKAIDMINKHLGTYEQDNRQKRNTVNIDNLDTLTVKNILNVLKTQ